MSFNKSILAFDDIRQVFDRALQTPRGLKIPCPSRGKAINLRSRFNYFRKIDRDESLKIYPTDHPMFGRSSYDKLALRVPEKGHPEENILFIEPHSAESYKIEEIKP
jgi:hypothetical protein